MSTFESTETLTGLDFPNLGNQSEVVKARLCLTVLGALLKRILNRRRRRRRRHRPGVGWGGVGLGGGPWTQPHPHDLWRSSSL